MTELEIIWSQRVLEVYPTIFGEMNDEIYALQPELFIQGFQQSKYDPKWLSYGVIPSAPNKVHDSWIYVSTGISDPWDDGTYVPQADEYSGMGNEWVIEIPERADWAIGLLHQMMAYQILTVEGELGPVPAPTASDAIRLQRSINPGEDSVLSNLLIVKPRHYDDSFKLVSGHADFFHLVGISDAEFEFGQQHGNDSLVEKLHAEKKLTVTDWERKSIL